MRDQYAVAYGQDLWEMVKMANEYMKDGYIPAGGVGFHMGQATFRYLQAFYDSRALSSRGTKA